MTKLLALAALVLALGGGAALAAAPADAAPPAGVTVGRTTVTNTDGRFVVCAVTSTGAIDCDWDHPSSFGKRIRHVEKVPHAAQ